MKLFGKKKEDPYPQNSDDKNKLLINAIANSGQDPVIATFLKNLAKSDPNDPAVRSLRETVAGGFRESYSAIKPLSSHKKGLIGTNINDWDPHHPDKKCFNCGKIMTLSTVMKLNEPGMRFVCKSCGYFVLTEVPKTASDVFTSKTMGTVIKEGIMDFPNF